MNSDIKLDEDIVTLEAFRVVIQGADLVLDLAERRTKTSDPARLRRALVHDEKDILTINYAEDYPGGVLIHGQVELTGLLLVKNLSTKRLTTNKLEIEVPTGEFGPPIAADSESGISPGLGKPVTETTDLGKEIQSLRSQIIELQNQINLLKVPSL